jgi:protein SCO1/2
VPARVRLVLIGVTMCAVAALGGVWIAALDAPGESPPSEWQGALRPPGASVPPFALRDQDGRVVTPPARPAVYTFLYSTCEDTCPLTVQQIRGALDDLGRDVDVIAVSVDPRGDTPARARRFLLKQSMTGRMSFLLGTKEQLAPVWRAFGIRPQEEGLEHSAYVVLADAQRRQRIGFPVGALTVDGLAADLARLTR